MTGALVLPIASVAVTVNVCAPSDRPFCAPAQGVSAPSSLQTGVRSFVVTAKVDEVSWTVVPSAGPPAIVTVGGVASTVQVRVCGVLELPIASTPRTENVCVPSASAGTCVESCVHVASGTLSTVQTRVPSLVVTPKSAVRTFVVEFWAGPPVRCTMGGVVSTTQPRTAGVVSTLPEGSTARTVSCQVPFAVRLGNVRLGGQAENEPRLPGPSSRHSNVASGSLVAENELKAAVVELVVDPCAGLPLITVSCGPRTSLNHRSACRFWKIWNLQSVGLLKSPGTGCGSQLMNQRRRCPSSGRTASRVWTPPC